LKIAKYSYLDVFNSPADGIPLKFCNASGAQKTRVMTLPDGPKSMTICTPV